MRKSAVENLGKSHWFPVEGDADGMQVEVIATAMWSLNLMRGEPGIRQLCEENFVGFTEYLDESGGPVENTVDERVKLFCRVLAVQNTVARGIGELQEEVLSGEAVAVSG